MINISDGCEIIIIASVIYLFQMKRAVVWVIALVVAEVSFAQTQEVEVLEYHPAPGQFVNMLPEAEETDNTVGCMGWFEFCIKVGILFG